MEKNRVIKAYLGVLKPEPDLTVSQWADNYRYIARGTSPEPGRWKTSRTPYAREIMDTFNTDASIVVVMASSQVAKTEIGLNIMCYYMDKDPSPIMYLLPTDDLANDFSKTRIDKTIRETPALSKMFSTATRDSDNTIGLKNFPGGYITIHGASTPTKLSSKPIRILIADEVDRYPKLLAGEGQPLKLAMQRTTNFWNRKILIISTPTAKEISLILEWFERSDKRYYHVPCPSCEKETVLKWELVKWELDEAGNLISESPHVECPSCGFQIKDTHKSEMLAKGRWIRTNDKSNIPGFHISSLYSPWVSLKELVEEFIDVANSDDTSKIREFLNLKLGEPFEEIVEDLDIALLETHKLEYNAELPDDVLYLTIGVDVQENRLEYQIVGFGENNNWWVIRYGILVGDPEHDDVWNGLDGILLRPYSFKDGKKLRISAGCVDSGYLADRVYKFTTPREHLRIAAIKGFGGEGIPIINNPTSKNRTHTKVMKVGVDAAKGVIYSRLRNHTQGKNFIYFPTDITHGCGDEYYKQLNSERRVLELKRGIKRFVWKKIRDRNEALDTFVYALAAYEMAAPDLALIKSLLAEQEIDNLNEQNDDSDTEYDGVISDGIDIYGEYR